MLNFIEINDTVVTFLWASEESGYRHLYLITSSLTQTENGISESTPQGEDRESVEESTLASRVISKVCKIKL